MKRLLALLLAVLMLGSLAAFADEEDEMLEPGDIITFGNFEQDGDESNGDEPIEWIVLDVDAEDHSALVISRYGLFPYGYTEEEAPVTWETSVIRALLNEYFLDEMFTEEEQECIFIVKNSNEDRVYDGYTVPGGNDTEDALYLLSLDEVEEYFPEEASRVCEPTAFAVLQGAWYVTENKVEERPFAFTEDEIGYASWWLRTPGGTDQCAAAVYADGSIPEYGSFGPAGFRCVVRPAMWIEF